MTAPCLRDDKLQTNNPDDSGTSGSFHTVGLPITMPVSISRLTYEITQWPICQSSFKMGGHGFVPPCHTLDEPAATLVQSESTNERCLVLKELLGQRKRGRP